MSQLRVLTILVNLALLRLVVATQLVGPTESARNNSNSKQLSNFNKSASEDIQEFNHQLNGQQRATSGSASVFDHISSLDFSPPLGDDSATNKLQDSIEGPHSSNSSGSPAQATSSGAKGGVKTGSGVANSRRRSRSRTNANTGSSGQPIASFLLNVLGQLEKVDVRRVLADLSQAVVQSTPTHAQSRTGPIAQPDNQRRDQVKNQQQQKQQQEARDGKLNVSALSAETGNLLSITKQLVKLARNQVLGDADQWGSAASQQQQHHYYAGSPSGGGGGSLSSSSWSTPAASMLSAASHALHDSFDVFGGTGHHHSMGALHKSDWFWWAAPAVIVIGSGVIVVPLVAAWLVSQAMNQNTFTVSTGRRRRKRRSTTLANLNSGADSSSSSSSWSPSSMDLFKMLDLHQLLDDAPELLAEKLARFYTALDHVGAQLANSSPSPSSLSSSSRAKFKPRR